MNTAVKRLPLSCNSLNNPDAFVSIAVVCTTPASIFSENSRLLADYRSNKSENLNDPLEF